MLSEPSKVALPLEKPDSGRLPSLVKAYRLPIRGVSLRIFWAAPDSGTSNSSPVLYRFAGIVHSLPDYLAEIHAGGLSAAGGCQ
jgi:hypothetical protein